MKNMRIAFKIALGYAVVVVLMLVISAVIIISGQTTQGELNDVNLRTNFQTAGNDLRASFYADRIYVNILYNVNSDKAYNDFKTNSEKTLNSANNLLNLANSNKQLFGDFVSQIELFISKLQTWRTEIDGIKENYKVLDECKAQVISATTEIQESLDGVLNRHVANGDDAATIARLSSTILTIKISEADAMHIMDTMDTTDIDALYTTIDTYRAAIDKGSATASATDKAAYVNLVNLSDEFKNTMVVFEDTLNTNRAETESTRADGFAILDIIDAGINATNQMQLDEVSKSIEESKRPVTVGIIVSVVSIIASILLGVVITRNITVPVNAMTKSLTFIAATGSFNYEDADSQHNLKSNSDSKDEIGQCVMALNEMIDHLKQVESNMQAIAHGDLTADVSLKSDKDTMAISMRKMIESLSGTFDEINDISVEIAENSKDVSDSSFSLAQGATEQTAAVAALSKSIEQVAVKTNESAEMAINAARLGDTIKNNAEIGSQQMEKMLDAVNQITLASSSISKVIKVIDDIAFQTNILALNAAVEAARAGQHGKGFAVVAEEVRNLAAKSAEAAKETSSLIENSIEKAELGASIATETSASLSEIVSGINESSKIVNVIASSSKEQTNSIKEINLGVTQVGEVVHLISKGAELSSNAALSMSSQSEALYSFISNYKTHKHNKAVQLSHKPSKPQPVKLVLPKPSANDTFDSFSNKY